MKTFRRITVLLLALLSVCVIPARAQLTVGAPQTISETRVGRTVFEYVMRASITNNGTTIAKGITATCTSSSPKTTVVEGTLVVGNVAPGAATASADTITIAHDRSVPFDPAVLQWTLTKVPEAPSINTPASPTATATATITGTAEPGATVEITGALRTTTGTASGTGAFSIDVDLWQDRLNRIFVAALNSAGRSEPVTADIIHDVVAPSLFIDFPPDGAQLTNDSVVVAGRVGDMLSGFAGLGVSVNGQPANVAIGLGNNGTFERGNVPLAMGTNTLTAMAADVNGNMVSKSITVTRVAITGPRMDAISGDAESAIVHALLAQPIVIRITNADGTPFPGKVVTFDVTRSDGRLSATGTAGDPNGLMLQAFTDADGYATAYWTLGGDAGCGNNRVSVTSKDIAGTIFFCASAMPAPPRQINIGSGNNQRAEAGGLAPESLRAWVSDSCNGIAGVPVMFTVTSGGGKVNGQDSVLVNTGATGHAEVKFTLGPDAGANTVEATFGGNAASPATFTAYGLVRDPLKPTTFTGLILDNTSNPIGGALCTLYVGGQSFIATSDAQGRFAFGAPNLPAGVTDLPSGRADLYVDATVATSLGVDGSGGPIPVPAGSFPALLYSPTLVPNAENSLSSPVLLPQLNPNNARLYDGTTDLVLTCEGMAGLKMTIKAGSMRKPDGRLVSPTNKAIVSLNQVHADNVPMPIPDGASPPFTWTLQPARSTFDPPIQVEYPNMSGLPAGSIAYFLTYNHDTEKFEIFASGHVTDDGSTILTDPGTGLSLSGWGCNCPPYSVTGKCANTCEEPAATALKVTAAANPSKVAVVFFQGGPALLDNSNGEFKGPLSVLADSLKATFGNRVFTFHTRSGNQWDQLAEARAKLESAFGGDDVCAEKPKVVLVGYSLGGDTIQFSRDPDRGINAALRISIDPISRFWVYLYPPLWNQRGEKYVTGAHENFLTPPLSDADHLECLAYSALIPVSENAVLFCLRGYEAVDARNRIAPGSQHGTIIEKRFGIWREITDAVATLLNAPAAASFTAPALPLAELAPDNEPPGDYSNVLDETMTLTVSGQTITSDGSGVLKISNISAPDAFGAEGPGTVPDFVSDDYVRVIGVSKKGGANKYVFSNFFQIRRGGTTPITDLTFIDTPPRKPDMLAAKLDRAELFIGETTQLRVTATFADKSTIDVTPATSWTGYRTSNPAIAKVDSNGVVTVMSAGIAYITAVNEGATAVATVSVSFGNAVTTVTGFLRRPDGSPAAGAIVQVLNLPAVVVGTDGSFTVGNIPADLGTLTLTARLSEGGNSLVAMAELSPVAGGITDGGILTLAPDQIPNTLHYSLFSPFRAQGSTRQGTTVAIDGNLTVVGAPYTDTAQTDAGVVNVYHSTTGALLYVLEGDGTYSGFGLSVAVNGSRVVVGAPDFNDNGFARGRVSVYDLASATPTAPVAIFYPPTPRSFDDDEFGVTVAVSGTRVVVGKRGGVTRVTDRGALMFMILPVPRRPYLW